MQKNQAHHSLEDQIGYNNPPFIRPLEDSNEETALSNHIVTKDLPAGLYFTQPSPPHRSNSNDGGFYNHNTRDNMSDIPTTSTPRLSDISSVDSPRNSLELTPTPGMNGNIQAASAGSQPSFNPLGGKTSPLAPDDTKIRRSSPDSDALTSSDEEAEHKKMFFPPNKHSAVSALSSRRPSYAAEFQNRQRTYSVVGGGPLSPTTSHPSTPSGDTAAWAAGMSSSGVGPGTGQSMWSIWNEPRKSPTKASSSVSGPSSQSPLFAGSEAFPSPTSMPLNGEFPIPIPLQPQPRNYRSMSFSVLDDHTRPRLSPPALHSGSRPPPAGLQHRPSRPSLLSEEQYAVQLSPLRSVFETEDDEEIGGPRDIMSHQTSSGYLQQASGVIPSQQANYMRRYESMKFRNRSASAASIPTMGLSGIGLAGIGSTVLGGGRDGERIFPGEESESALADDDDFDFHHFNGEQRRYSEVPRSMSLLHPHSENQRLENLRSKQWATVGGGPFGGLESGNQSRRHSFAGGLPTMNEAYDKEIGFGSKRTISPPRFGDNGVSSLAGRDPFYLDEVRLRTGQGFSAASKTAAIGPTESPSQHHLQQLQAYTSTNRLATQPSPPPAGGPHRGLMSMAPHHAQQPRSQQVLYFVSFKACRGDVFYVQEGTGLRVRNGDLVIVEADRGTDLGTVTADNITWQQAKEMKERSAKQQYNWLMMLASRKAACAPAGTVGGAPGFTDGTAGVMPGSHQGQDGATGELKPKMIKRLAQPHEINTLRDKEANEAKAKRVCQQKVAEHRLPMEILDAEFQMDWKKLTFYYFADSYINFNSLVTDLFKVYKTRIWMSAMNPASFAHPTGLHLPGTGLTTANGLASIGETPNEQGPPIFHTPQYGTVSQSYASGYTTSTGGTGGMMSTGHRAQQPAAMSTFPGRQHGSMLPHQEFNLSQQQLNGYNSTYLNGAAGGHIQGEGPTTTNGGADAWMSLPGLSLHSH
ncbi:hypothetical protein RUND412_001339 [Rhizina undulata]